MANVPMITFPHFGDQMGNSQLLIDAGAALKIANFVVEGAIQGGDSETATLVTFKDPCFTGDDVYNNFNKLLTDS
jgi:hypothetical protein